MGKLYWLGVACVFSIGMGVVLFFGLGGKTVPKIKWSHFLDSQEVAHSIQLRLRQELQSYDLVFLGPHPDKSLHIEAAVGVLKWLKQTRPSVVIVDPQLIKDREIPHDVILDLMSERERFLQGLSKIPNTHRVIVLAPNLFVTHLLSQSPLQQMKEELKNKNYGVLSFVHFPQNREAEASFDFPCQTEDETSVGLSELGCFIRQQSRRFYVKSSIEGKIPGFLNQIRSAEFMFFLGH